MEGMKAIIDTGNFKVIVPGPGGFRLELSPGSVIINCEKAMSGHMMMPTSDWTKPEKDLGKRMRKSWTWYGTMSNADIDSEQSRVQSQAILAQAEAIAKGTITQVLHVLDAAGLGDTARQALSESESDLPLFSGSPHFSSS